MLEVPDGAWMIGGPRGGTQIAIPGAPHRFVCAEAPDASDMFRFWLQAKQDPMMLVPRWREHIYQLEGVFKVYSYTGAW